MDVRHLRSFLAVAEEGSIHAGARRLTIAQPALSQALRKLERDLDVTLLVRSSRGIELTAAGRALVEHARDVVARFDRTTEIVRAAGGTAAGGNANGERRAGAGGNANAGNANGGRRAGVGRRAVVGVSPA
jgi:LysR family transcriptional regulator, nitrogen assimilation regulatory protein